ASAPESRGVNSELLVVQFHDAPPTGGQLPALLPETSSSKSNPGAITLGGPQIDSSPQKRAGNADSSTAAPSSARQKKPIDVSARVITSDVLRTAGKTDLEKVRCE